MKYTKDEVAQARERLLNLLKPGDTVLCILRNVSRSGMSREIDLQFADGETFHWLSLSVAVLLGLSLGKRAGVKIGGCGMDMGFALVNSLSYALFPKYRCPGTSRKNPRRCASADHIEGDCLKKRVHTDGYALKHRWL